MAGHHAHAHATDALIQGGTTRLARVILLQLCPTTCIATSAHLLKLLSLLAPLQSHFSTSELDSPNRHRPENTFNLQEGRAAHFPVHSRKAGAKVGRRTQLEDTYPHWRCSCCRGLAQAPLTVWTMHERQTCSTAQHSIHLVGAPTCAWRVQGNSAQPTNSRSLHTAQALAC